MSNFTPTALKYRPVSFGQVVGHAVSKRIMVNSLKMGRQINCMLISGIRGTGKTTLARLYAKSVNCENFTTIGDVCNTCSSCLEALNGTHSDIIELDAASNNGVDAVRNLMEVFRQAPVFGKRVVIFDEAHMLTKQAQAALLKVLEEPPHPLLSFILVTTNPNKLENTIRSRCLNMPLSPLKPEDILQNVSGILQSEGYAFDEDLLNTLSVQGGGSLRDVQQIVDQLILAAGDSKKLDTNDVRETFGVLSEEEYKHLAAVIDSRDLKLAQSAVTDWLSDGMDLNLLFETGVPTLLRDFSVVLSGSYSNRMTLYSGLSADLIKNRLQLSLKDVKKFFETWENVFPMLKTNNRPEVIWQLFFVRLFEE
ncbi:DNA polymerase III subunit gamma/tau [bacterium]|nr:DNA polymerase III subunit gamma/tau [bacterium]